MNERLRLKQQTESRTKAPKIGVGVGLGTFPFSNVFSRIDDRIARGIVEEFLGGGGRYIETAPVYPVNAVRLGDVLSVFPRSDFFLATKCVTGFRDGTRIRSGATEWLHYQVESELKRLKVEHFDLLQAHIVPDDTTIEDLVTRLDHFRSQGTATFIGLSNVSAETLKRALAVAPVDFVQNRFSLLHREEHRGLTELAEEHGFVLNPYQVIERGQLTSRVRRPSERVETDVRNTKHEYVGEAFDVVRLWVEELLLPIANSAGLSLQALTIAWTRLQGDRVLPIVGCTSRDQAAELLRSAAEELDDGTLAQINAAYSEMNRRTRERFGLTLDEYRGLR